jgi:hypothetical protein
VLFRGNGCTEDNTFKQKGDDVYNTPLSMFQFNLSIAPLTLATSKEEQSRAIFSMAPPPA